MGLSDWAGFYSAEVGASAALAGLVAVAISINLNRILEFEHLPSRAGESLFALTATLVICGVALFPGLSPAAFGLLSLALAVSLLAFGAKNQMTWRRQIGRSELARQVLSAASRLASGLPVGVGGALLLFHAPGGLACIAAGVVITLAVSVMNAWVLLVEIMR